MIRKEAYGWRPPKPKWDWRAFLTQREKLVLARADAAKAVWRELNKERTAIRNRAEQRARYAARSA